MNSRIWSFLLAPLFLAMAHDVHAGVVFSNLGGDTISVLPVANNPSLYSESTPYVGSSFVVGTEFSTWNLDSVTLKMDSADPTTTGAFSVAIYANASDSNTLSKPGALLGTLTGFTPGSSAPLSPGEYVYTASPGSILLTAGSTYWLVAQAPLTSGGDHAYNWDQTDTAYTASTGWSIDPTRAITVFHSGYDTDTRSWYDDTASTGDNIVYRIDSAGGDARNFGLDGFMQFSLSASQASGVPEPCRALFALLGLLTLGLRRRREW